MLPECLLAVVCIQLSMVSPCSATYSGTKEAIDYFNAKLKDYGLILQNGNVSIACAFPELRLGV